ncbi:hypothetical protein C3Y98_04370 [Methylotenera oryzisoli]|uniref:DUF697 domain-containing protein n=1 Tax=Methylotenera oryzisoli TaxID=2080758 RepID=A0A4Y9VTQ2_9PROT|nr:DUF697 domain-containing protein [Methylotenera oryzisoli]TFW72346.1 hypothetical protein C3Y98_04370 [Methylotenera oryzisoli]
MNKSMFRIIATLSVFALLYICIVLVGNIIQIADAADRIYLGAGQPIFWGLLSVFIVTAISPFYLYFKLPKALIPPSESSGPEFDKYLVQLRQRLSRNSRLNGVSLESEEAIESALEKLSKESDKVVRETATAVFVSTSIMQNGRLDGLITLFTQARMVWRIACVYQQRPSPRQMLYLYSNVGVNVLFAESIEEIDFSEIVAPLFASSVTSSIPGMSLIMSSIANGTANAFLTLRVGSITKQYCEALSTPSRSFVRRSATISAIAIVGDIVKENGARIVNGSWGMFKGAVDSTLKGAKSVASKVGDSSLSSAKAVGNTISSTFDSVKNIAGKITPK